MVVTAVALAQMQRNQIIDTYETLWQGIDAADIETLKGLPELARVGSYYMLGQEPSKQGYTASYVYIDREIMHIAHGQMRLSEVRVPEKADEVVVSEYFLIVFGNDAGVGDRVTLDTESFHGDYTVTGIMDIAGEKEMSACAFDKIARTVCAAVFS